MERPSNPKTSQKEPESPEAIRSNTVITIKPPPIKEIRKDMKRYGTFSFHWSLPLTGILPENNDLKTAKTVKGFKTRAKIRK